MKFLVWRDLADQGVTDIEAEGILKDRIKLVYVADMRYLGEGHEVQVTVPKNVGQSEMVQFAWKEFHNVHDSTFGFHYEGEQDVEIVNLRVQAIGEQYRPDIGVNKGPKTPAKKLTPDEPIGMIGLKVLFLKELTCNLIKKYWGQL